MKNDTINKYFKCSGCGNCCRVPGYVHVDEKELSAIASLLHISERGCVQKYTRIISTRSGLSLIEKEDGSCVFLEGDTCTIYPVRPWQCRTFPFIWRVPEIGMFCQSWRKLFHV